MMRRVANMIIGLGVMLSGLAVASALPATPVSAATCPGREARLLTFPAWYNGVVDEQCNLESPGNDTNELRDFIARIALNIVEIILQLVGYTCVVFIIIGGFRYMTNNDDPGGLTTARKIITNAIIGLVISIGAVIIVNMAAGVV